MKIAILKIKLYAPWVHSLKEKRMVVKSLLAKIRNKFHVSAAEVEDQDVHQSIIIGIASIVPHSAQADAMMDEIVHFIEQSTEAEIVEEEREIRQGGYSPSAPLQESYIYGYFALNPQIIIDFFVTILYNS